MLVWGNVKRDWTSTSLKEVCRQTWVPWVKRPIDIGRLQRGLSSSTRWKEAHENEGMREDHGKKEGNESDLLII